MSFKRNSLRFAIPLLMGISVIPAAQAATSNGIFAYSFNQTTELVLNTNLGQVTLSQSSRGWWDQTGLHYADNDNYFAGFCGSSDACFGNDIAYNNFFIFDLSGFTGGATSATLHLFNKSVDGFISSSPSLDYSVWDVSTKLGVLAASGTGRVDIFNDLGSGLNYGGRTMTAADNGVFVDIALNTNALAYINSNGGNTVAFGGTVGAVPEPETYAMLMAGLGLMGAVARRRKSKQA